eukprot:Rhum_TRINITY_DN14635_c13_g1::Rhum_TRINITY_DN14635_c13_g1_i1::g.105814::m.105814
MGAVGGDDVRDHRRDASRFGKGHARCESDEGLFRTATADTFTYNRLSWDRAMSSEGEELDTSEHASNASTASGGGLHRPPPVKTLRATSIAFYPSNHPHSGADDILFEGERVQIERTFSQSLPHSFGGHLGSRPSPGAGLAAAGGPPAAAAVRDAMLAASTTTAAAAVAAAQAPSPLAQYSSPQGIPFPLSTSRRAPAPPVASSLPCATRMKRASLRINLQSLEDMKKPLDPVTDETPHTPAARSPPLPLEKADSPPSISGGRLVLPPAPALQTAADPVAKKLLEDAPAAEPAAPAAAAAAAEPAKPAKQAWKPRRRMVGVKMPEKVPIHVIWCTATNKRFTGYGGYSEGTQTRRMKQELSLRNSWEKHGAVRTQGILGNASSLLPKQESPEDAMMKLKAALRSQLFAVPPTAESLAAEGVVSMTYDQIRSSFWYSPHCPLRSFAGNTFYECSERTKAQTKPVEHHCMKVVKKVSLTNEKWEQLYLDLQVLKAASHPSCGSLVRVFHSEKEVHTVVGRYAQHSDLLRRVEDKGCVELSFVQAVARQIVDVFRYLHDTLKIAYCNLSGADMLVSDSDQILLTDFQRVRCLSPSAPISLSFRRVSRRSSPDACAGDMKTLGCLIHLLTRGHIPLGVVQKADPLPADFPMPSLFDTITAAEAASDPWLSRDLVGATSLVLPDDGTWATKVIPDFETLHKLVFCDNALDKA